ncbi:hypothetical protein CUJ91_00180 [Paraburkholderia graminis]|uniref:hypothetical protein n=1 Tax=Paraburkholderia graminis TaxID=60548 RepID=UPI000DEEC658|nr:hypothetical protein [Paraburkholderia graminis]AXF06493.1 hypothetical protein CUJ91_00180 [Paraburkholderia graminis]
MAAAAVNIPVTLATMRRHISTDEFADRLLVLRQTVLKAYNRDGAYCGVRPVRLPNRRLAWPIAEIEKLFETQNSTMAAKEAA